MSWYVEEVLRFRNKIEKDIEQDLYCDILSVEMVINALKKENLLSEEDIKIIDGIGDTGTFYDIPGVDKNRVTMSARFSTICDIIALILGNHFTDEGYLGFMQKKYKLSNEQVQKLRSSINSPKRHCDTRKGNNAKETIL